MWRVPRLILLPLLALCLQLFLFQCYEVAGLVQTRSSFWGLASWPTTQVTRINSELFFAKDHHDENKERAEDQQQRGSNSWLKTYKFGDLTKGILKTATSAINDVTGKDQYEFGDFSKWLDQQAKARVSNLTGQEYEFGDISKWLDQQAKAQVTNFTGLSQYQVGDISKEIVRRVAAGEYKLQDLVLAIKVLIALGASFTPVGAALPTKILLELFNYSVAQEVGEKVVGALAESLDQRLKATLTGDAKYQLGDLTKKALTKALAEYSGKPTYEFGDLSRTIASRLQKGTSSQVLSKKTIQLDSKTTKGLDEWPEEVKI